VDFSQKKIKSWLLLDVPAELNYECSLAIKNKIEQLVQNEEKNICLNLSQTAFVGSSALGVFLYAQKHVENIGGKFCLMNPNGPIAATLDSMGITRIVNVIKEESELD
jgi:anti-anti-sigma factor